MRVNPFLISIIVVIFLGLNVSDAQAQAQAIKPTRVITPIHYDISRKLSDVEPIPPGFRARSWKDNLIKNKTGFLEEFKNPPPFITPDPVVQDYSAGSSRDITIQQNYDGVNNLNGVAPPDTDGDVGPNHYFQMINLSFAIWNKSGTMLYGPADNQTIWEGFDDGQPFDNNNDGDPIILYDEQADRWLVSQFALSTTNDKYYELVAISSTPDPTGSWYRYAFEFDNMPDYPKFGIWPDGYYLSINQFANGSTWAGGGACVLDRDAMMAGEPAATMVFFSLSTTYGSLLPADCDGVFPIAGTPGYFVNMGSNLLRIWELSVNWITPSSSTLTLVQTLSTAAFSNSGISIAQPGTTQTLDPLGDRLMFRVQYRKFGTYSVMLTNHTVKPDGTRAGVRWYELRKTGSSWAIHQQGTYAPADGNSRWMGSIAMNGNGDIALGYSVSSSSTYPSIRFTGQSASNSGTGVMDIAETSIFTGAASQTGVNRWGDYSMMSVDPVGDLTFWYTQEYSTGGWAWKTRIASFLFTALPTSSPVADFSASATTVAAGSPVHFSDLSSNFPTSWSWTFTGGSPSSSTSKNPTITYTTPGTYDVTLIAANGIGSDTETKTGYITITPPPPPVANFIASATLVSPGGSVTFYDNSTNAPTSWSWTFEGGTPATSTLQNPAVTYNTYGTYDVTLTAANGAGSDSETKLNYITVDIIYCSSNGNNYSDEWISQVVLGAFTKNSGAAGYSNYTQDTISVMSGNTYNLTLTPGYSGTVWNEYWKVWIDYNHDGDFADSGEEVFAASNVQNTVTGTVTIPSGLNIATRMRVSMKYGSAPGYCETFTYGEVEDYTILISPAAPMGGYVYLKDFLQGPYDATTNLMRTDLKTAGLLPLMQPYASTPLTYSGTESVTSFNDNVVDWVIVELRTDTTAGSMVVRKAALLLNNGEIAGTDQVSAPFFPEIVQGNPYYVVIYHRNHFPVMTASAITLPNTQATRFDLTASSANAYRSTNAVFPLEAGVYGQIAGDINMDNVLRYANVGNDQELIFNRIASLNTPPVYLTAIATGYYPEDVNMDAIVRYMNMKNDQEIIFSNIDFYTTPTYLTTIKAGVVPVSY